MDIHDDNKRSEIKEAGVALAMPLDVSFARVDLRVFDVRELEAAVAASAENAIGMSGFTEF